MGARDRYLIGDTAGGNSPEHIARAGLRTSEGGLRLSIEAMPAEIAILDRDMCYLAVSRRFAEAYNVNYDGIIGRSHYDLFPEIPDRWREIHRRCLAGDTERCAEDQFPREDGSLDWVSWEIFPWTDEGDAIGGIVIISENITSRKKFEEALLQSQQDLNHAQAVAHIGSWRLDVRNNILHWSDENYRIFGAPQGEPQTYQSFLEFVHPADREMVDAAWMNALAGKPYDIEHRILVDQKTKWVREQAILEFDENGVLTAGFGTTQDITDVVSARHALSRERAFLRQVIDAVPSLVFVKDRGGRFLLSNQALARCYGTDTGSIIGLTDEKLNLNADETAGFNRDDLDVITSGETKYILEEKVTHSDGVVHWYDTVKVPLVEDDGRCDKVLGVATDVTKRKHAEDLLRLVDRRKDDFLAMLAHELRNPLAPILNAVQFLKMCATADPMLASSCNMIARQVAHIKQQLDDLLDIARIMQGKITLTTEHLKISDIVDQAIETSSPLIESRRQELVVSQATTLWIAGDRTRLVQTLSNLLNNAAKYTHEGGNITLRVMREGSEVVIAVRDNGIGISPDLLPHVFDPFTQADHSLAHSQGGLGIGLSMVRQLVELHGGKVMVESAGINRGSLFTVRLPALQTEHPAPGAGLTETAVAMSKLRILVVDDYPDAAESMMLLLQANGHEVETAGFGFQAIERARVFRPQVVLLDIGLPDMDGYEVSRQMRDMPESREAKIIALTGYGTHKDVERARLAGFNHHLLKPVDYETLSSILSSI